jgi:hypothetical protein
LNSWLAEVPLHYFPTPIVSESPSLTAISAGFRIALRKAEATF